MKTRKEFEDDLCKNYLRDKRMSKLLLAGIVIIGLPAQIALGLWLFITGQEDPISTFIIISIFFDGAIYSLVQVYFFIFGSPGVESERKRLPTKISEKNVKRMLYEAQGSKRKAEKLQRKIWKMEFDLKTIGGSVPE